ncbi:DUF4369 domain-containing protein [Draconibacterium sp. IB214405]|uniref:DUF4369 domain-containing protein n=1 Tax=Draconibacterium sp. IB214405 TaxID=3097352 RepID=UPI002A13A059|nr:DUF4369 domain-containing protein [Draconibacterium sp. IB214405]MDX8338053.1 DUF4369 domain-containing protein [Draconibacterium sp. IB214405]
MQTIQKEEKVTRMIKIVLPLLLAALVFTACNTNQKFEINGQVSDKNLDGEWVYLVPMVNAPVERVDSTQLKNGSFTFKGKVAEPEIYIIRMRPFLRLSHQELLVVKEPGTLQVYLGANSKVAGTALNDSLQTWKVQKEIIDNKMLFLQQNLKNADVANQDKISNELEKLRSERANYSFRFVKNNRNNVVGEMVSRIMKGAFTPEQRKELGIE